jgi:hypothetical protein
MSLLPRAALHSGSEQVLLKQKKRSRKSHAWAPLRGGKFSHQGMLKFLDQHKILFLKANRTNFEKRKNPSWKFLF